MRDPTSRSAVTRLTLGYLGVIMTLSLLFSLLFYFSSTTGLDVRVDTDQSGVSSLSTGSAGGELPGDATPPPVGPPRTDTVALAREVNQAIANIAEGYDAFNVNLLFGITGSGKTDRLSLPENQIREVKRWSSLGNLPVADLSGQWELSLIIHIGVFAQSNISVFDGLQAKANFYKCGDNLKVPHFLSWNPIENDTPNFHLSKYFGNIQFE